MTDGNIFEQPLNMQDSKKDLTLDKSVVYILNFVRSPKYSQNPNRQLGFKFFWNTNNVLLT